MKQVSAISIVNINELIVEINKNIENGFELLGSPVQDKKGNWIQFFIKEYVNPLSFAAIDEDNCKEVVNNKISEEEKLLEWIAKKDPVDCGSGVRFCNIGNERVQLSYKALLVYYKTEKK